MTRQPHPSQNSPSLAARLVSLPVHAYRLVLSPLLPPACRFEPSCSRYALEALAVHGALRGTALAVRRICRCHPWGGMGFDPVPPKGAGAGSPASKIGMTAEKTDSFSCRGIEKPSSD